MAGYSSASWATWCARNGCITKDTPPPFDLPSTTSGYTPLDSGHGLQQGGDPLRVHLQLLEVVAEELHGIGPFDPRERLLHVVADELREVEVDRRELLEFLAQLVLDHLAGDAA